MTAQAPSQQPAAFTAAGRGRPTPTLAGDRLVSLRDPASFEAEQYRLLRLFVEQRRKTANLHTVAVTSPGVGDGKTTTVVNLAGALAQSQDVRILVADLDLRRPSVARHLGYTSSHPGVVEAVLDGGLSLDQILLSVRPNLAVLHAGRPIMTPYEVLKSEGLHELLQQARRAFDYIVIDTPPLVPFPDSQIIEKLADGVVIVVAAHRTPRKFVQAALRLIEPAKNLGLVFNADDGPITRHYYNHYYSHYHPGSRKRT